MRLGALLGRVLMLALPGHAFACWDEAGSRYGVSPHLLYAIARVESRLNPQAINLTHRQRTGTYDIGLMQINSSNLPALARHGIGERDLYNPCTNINVGAWLLAQTFSRHGVNWDGVGAYNAACTQLRGPACQSARSRYAWLVYRQLPAQQTQQAPRVAQTTTVRPPILTARVSP
jgi:soluble lytic murein transglycosylase-like protein